MPSSIGAEVGKETLRGPTRLLTDNGRFLSQKYSFLIPLSN
jgi:hypothetical protein